MARFLVFGSVAWDRPIWLDRPLSSGGRLLGLMSSESGSRLAAGRLGGGGANSAACLKNAGNDVAIWCAVRTDAVGKLITDALDDLGIDTSFLKPAPSIIGETLVFIEPGGERTILFQHAEPDLDRTMRRMRKQESAPVSMDKILEYAPSGIYLRSVFSGIEDLRALPELTCVAHWPQHGESQIPANILIGSKADLGDYVSPADAFAQGQKACGKRLKWLILTSGKEGGEIHSETGCVRFKSASVTQVDATGAGDAFAAGVLEAVTLGADIVEAAEHGARWGAATASLKGCAESRPPNTYRSWANAFDPG